MILESGTTLEQMGSDPRYALLGELSVPEGSGIPYQTTGSRLVAVGGTSNLWTGRCSRLHPVDFQPNAYSPGWPISYAELAGYLSRAEETLRVRGGALSSYHAPRSGPLPLPADLDISGLKERMARIGLTIDDSPTSTSPTVSGEPVRAARDLLPSYLALPNAALISGSAVTNFTVRADGRITSAEVTNLDRESTLIDARAFIVACGGIGSPHLLLSAKSERWPNGIGNDYDQVGRYFTEHPNLTFRGMIPHTIDTLSPMYELGRSHQYYDEFKASGLGSILIVVSQSWVYRDDISSADRSVAERIGGVIGRLSQAELRIGVTMEMLPSPDNRVTLSNSAVDARGTPAAEIRLAFAAEDRRTMSEIRNLVNDIYAKLDGTDITETGLSWSHHHIGTCRMGSNAANSVVDRDLKVHGTQNLYVASSAVFPAGGAAHPTLTIAALSHRLAEKIEVELATGNL